MQRRSPAPPPDARTALDRRHPPASAASHASCVPSCRCATKPTSAPGGTPSDSAISFTSALNCREPPGSSSDVPAGLIAARSIPMQLAGRPCPAFAASAPTAPTSSARARLVPTLLTFRMLRSFPVGIRVTSGSLAGRLMHLRPPDIRACPELVLARGDGAGRLDTGCEGDQLGAAGHLGLSEQAGH